MFSCFITIECYCISSIMVSCIVSRCYSNRIISVTTIIYCYCFTSCIFNSIFRNGYFVLSTRIIYIFTACNRNISNISIASCSCFFNYAFSRCSTTSSCIYSVNIFTISTCSFSNSYIGTSFYNSFSCFQLFIVNTISIICTRSYVSDFFATSIDTSFSNGWTTSNSHTSIIDFSIANC